MLTGAEKSSTLAAGWAARVEFPSFAANGGVVNHGRQLHTGHGLLFDKGRSAVAQDDLDLPAFLEATFDHLL